MARLLLIEDDATIRHPLMRALKDRGHAVASVATAMAGVQTALTERPDLVVLDLGLPDLDGREWASWSSIPGPGRYAWPERRSSSRRASSTCCTTSPPGPVSW